jgi:predicted TIM-barrel fold metal-dependent hydrolase
MEPRTPRRCDPEVIISMDSHTDVYVDLKPYLPSRFQDDFSAAVRRSEVVMRAGFEHFRREVQDGQLPTGGSAELEDGEFPSRRVNSLDELLVPMDLDERLQKIDADGVAGEFITEFGGAVSLDPEFMHARFEAYCRWFGDYVSAARHRFTGSANVTLIGGMGIVLDEVAFAHDHGLRAVQLPGKVATMSPSLPPYHAGYYEPMWARLDELDMAAVFHSGFGPEKPLLTYPGLEPGADELAIFERRRGVEEALPYILLGNVLERHPRLSIGYIECGTEWIPPLLNELDGIVRRSGGSSHLLPSEQWHRQGFAAGPLTPSQLVNRHGVGLQNMMWGSDFPHAEGTYPHSREYIDKLFADVDASDRHAIIAGNAARTMKFDLAELGGTPAALVGA